MKIVSFEQTRIRRLHFTKKGEILFSPKLIFKSNSIRFKRFQPPPAVAPFPLTALAGVESVISTAAIWRWRKEPDLLSKGHVTWKMTVNNILMKSAYNWHSGIRYFCGFNSFSCLSAVISWPQLLIKWYLTVRVKIIHFKEMLEFWIQEFNYMLLHFFLLLQTTFKIEHPRRSRYDNE